MTASDDPHDIGFAPMVAMSLEMAKNGAIAAVVLAGILALVVASVIRNLTVKLVTIVLLVGAGAAVWNQRDHLQKCATTISNDAKQGRIGGGVCQFFDRSVTLPSS